MARERTIAFQKRPWRPGLCSDCHRVPGKQGLRRGLCLACYQYRRRRKLGLPPRASSTILHRKVKDEKPRGTIARRPWER